MADTVDIEALNRARKLLQAPSRKDRVWPALAAAALAATSALGFAVAMIVAPPVVSQPVEGVD
ncbi:hypothetical protein [Phenylobacterium sp.]|jgi:hypothetical protein|uniref:hypothetical protein n=1 Tax=Phenylobacterium sp. TaxID=1871053 RepID=UPI003784D5BD